MLKLRAVLFDLDDTLYDETDYVAEGFRKVADEIAQWAKTESTEVLGFMHAELARSGRGRIFDAALAAFGVPATTERVRSLVDEYRSCRPRLTLFPDAERVLQQLSGRFRLGVVTDGLPSMQRAKLKALNLAEKLDGFVCCWDHEAPKPATLGYRIALERLGIEPAEAMIVGDRPDHDIAAANVLGCVGVRIRRGRFIDQPTAPHVAHREIDSLDELPGILMRERASA